MPASVEGTRNLGLREPLSDVSLENRASPCTKASIIVRGVPPPVTSVEHSATPTSEPPPLLGDGDDRRGGRLLGSICGAR